MTMNRRAFLKLSGAFAAVVAAPALAKSEGMQVWGDKTLTASASSLQYINARRVIGKVEKAVGEAYAAFVEDCPVNDDITRKQLTVLIVDIMDMFQKSRVVYDFQVVCDATNNPPSVIDDNDLKLRVSFKDSCSLKITVIDAFIQKDVTSL